MRGASISDPHASFPVPQTPRSRNTPHSPSLPLSAVSDSSIKTLDDVPEGDSGFNARNYTNDNVASPGTPMWQVCFDLQGTSGDPSCKEGSPLGHRPAFPDTDESNDKYKSIRMSATSRERSMPGVNRGRTYEAWLKGYDEVNDLREHLVKPRKLAEVLKFLHVSYACPTTHKEEASEELLCSIMDALGSLETQVGAVISLERDMCEPPLGEPIEQHQARQMQSAAVPHPLGAFTRLVKCASSPDAKNQTAHCTSSMYTSEVVQHVSTQSMEFSKMLKMSKQEMLSIVSDALSAAEEEAGAKREVLKQYRACHDCLSQYRRVTQVLRTQMNAASNQMAVLYCSATAGGANGSNGLSNSLGSLSQQQWQIIEKQLEVLDNRLPSAAMYKQEHLCLNHELPHTHHDMEHLTSQLQHLKIQHQESVDDVVQLRQQLDSAEIRIADLLKCPAPPKSAHVFASDVFASHQITAVFSNVMLNGGAEDKDSRQEGEVSEEGESAPWETPVVLHGKRETPVDIHGNHYTLLPAVESDCDDAGGQVPLLHVRCRLGSMSSATSGGSTGSGGSNERNMVP